MRIGGPLGGQLKGLPGSAAAEDLADRDRDVRQRPGSEHTTLSGCVRTLLATVDRIGEGRHDLRDEVGHPVLGEAGSRVDGALVVSVLSALGAIGDLDGALHRDVRPALQPDRQSVREAADRGRVPCPDRLDGTAIAQVGCKPEVNTRSYTTGMSKIMVSLPEELLHEIDEVARRRSMSRSALLAAAARREIARPNPSDVDDAIIRSEQRFRTAGRFEAADLVRRDRDSRR